MLKYHLIGIALGIVVFIMVATLMLGVPDIGFFKLIWTW